MATFDIKTYIENLCDFFAHLQIEPPFDFEFTQVSGLNGLEGVISGQSHYDNFIATDATGDGYIVQNRGNGGYFLRRVATVFILRKYKYMDMNDMLAQMEVCRSYFKRIVRHMVHDQKDLELNLIYLDTERIAFREFEPETSAHFTGLYFMIEYEQPYNLLSDGD